MTRRTFFIADDIWKRLEIIALRDGLRISDLVRRAIAEWLRKEEKKDGE